MDNKLINVRNFSITPGSRSRDEGQKSFSGQEFREDVVQPILDSVLNTSERITINLDGTIGYGTSWLEEVFGGLARIYGKDVIKKKVILISNEEPYLIEDINQYIDNA